MFNSKRTTLFQVKPFESNAQKTSASTMKTTNPFLKAAMKKQAETKSENGSLKYNTTGSDFVDQFANATAYKAPRQYDVIANDMQALWSKDAELAIALAFYFRMITRQTKLENGTKLSTVQRGQGLKHEGIMRMMWIAINKPDTFWKNINLWISAGSWKDIIVMLQTDLIYNGWEGRVLNWNLFGSLIFAGLENPNSSELVKKYLPQIKARSKCTTVESQADTMIAKWLCSLMKHPTSIKMDADNSNTNSASHYKRYRKLKSSGTAHQWQQLISQGKFLKIDFGTIHGRALSQLVSSKFLKNHNLTEKYENWLKTQPVAKYTGYVYELLSPVAMTTRTSSAAKLTQYQLDTIDKQFDGLIELARKGMNTNSKLITVVDTSGSMNGMTPGTKVCAYSVAISMALYFARLLDGPFKNAWFEFNDATRLRFFEEGSATNALKRQTSNIIGSTNFLSVAKKFVEMKKDKTLKEEDFPTGILCLSDGEFNSASSIHITNVKEFKKILTTGGFSSKFVKDFKIILWDIPNGYYNSKTPKFEDFADTLNLFHIGGLDGSIVSFLTGDEKKSNSSIPKNSEELFLAAMNQELLQMLSI